MRFNRRQMQEAKKKASRRTFPRLRMIFWALAGAGTVFLYAYHYPDRIQRGGDPIVAQIDAYAAKLKALKTP